MAISILLSLNLYLFFQNNNLELIIRDQETGVIYARSKVELNDVLTFQWEHSVEKTAWQEKLSVEQDGTLILIETRFRSFGSGVPYKKDGDITFEDGFVVMKNLYEVKENYQWIHSQNAKFTIYKNDKIFLLPKDIPHYHKAEIIIKKG